MHLSKEKEKTSSEEKITTGKHIDLLESYLFQRRTGEYPNWSMLIIGSVHFYLCRFLVLWTNKQTNKQMIIYSQGAPKLIYTNKQTDDNIFSPFPTSALWLVAISVKSTFKILPTLYSILIYSILMSSNAVRCDMNCNILLFNSHTFSAISVDNQTCKGLLNPLCGFVKWCEVSWCKKIQQMWESILSWMYFNEKEPSRQDAP